MALSLNKILTFISIVCMVLLIVQCKQSEDKKTEAAVTETDSVVCSTKSLNPNGDSELALLMRNMVHSSESLKELIKQGKLPDQFPEEFLKIHTAKPTDSNTKKASFDGFASLYIGNMQTLFKSSKEDLTANYNAVISACVSCHTEHCPGPLKKIRQLSIE